jgi:phage shock protein A
MGTFGRLQRWLRLRGGLFRNPDAELARACDELETRLMHGRAEVSACECEERRLAALTSDAEWLAAQTLDFARRALYLGHEEWAREAVARHLQSRRQARLYARHWRRQQDDVARLRQTLETLETHLAELEHRRQALATRRHIARTQHLLLKGLHGKETRAAVEIAEERALTEEYTADAYTQLVADPLADEIDALPDPRHPDPVAGMLARLKEEMQPPGR